MAEDDENVRIFCRIRPPSDREKRISAQTPSSLPIPVSKCISVPPGDQARKTVLLHTKTAQNTQCSKAYTYDRVFDESSTQNEVFEVVGLPITQACLNGYNGTIFAYGQTGSGKTFTMQGPDDALLSNIDEYADNRGLVPRVFDYLYHTELRDIRNNNQDIGQEKVDQSKEGIDNKPHYKFTCSFLEIYNERVYDLLESRLNTSSMGLALREKSRKGVYVEGLATIEVDSAKKAVDLMRLGAQNRRVGQTAMNRESSRSHSVFMIDIESSNLDEHGNTRKKISRFSLVDLAGSERQKSTESAGERLKEAGSINKSLSALGNVIMGLVNKSAGRNCHVHYRDSKLTFLLKDSLGGNSKTFMIATISPAEDSANETLSTLKFAQRAKLIRNQAFVNEDISGSVSFLQQEIQRLRLQLQARNKDMVCSPHLVALGPTSEDILSFTETAKLELQDSYDDRLQELEITLATNVEESTKIRLYNEQLVSRNDRLCTDCDDLSKKVSHLRFLLRLASSRNHEKQCFSSQDQQTLKELADAELEYEPSADAIEWRIKFEELEEKYRQLHAMSDSHADIEGESVTFGAHQQLLENHLALSKQYALVVQDKHHLQSQITRLKEGVQKFEDGATAAPMQLAEQARIYEAKLSAATQVQISLEQKAASASKDLLRSKQREAAWNIKHKDTERQLQEALVSLRQESNILENLRLQLVEEMKRNHAIVQELEQKHTTAQLQSEKTIMKLENDNTSLQLQHDNAKSEAEMLSVQTEDQKEELRDMKQQLDACQNRLSQREHVLKRLECQIRERDADAEEQQVKLDLAEAQLSIVKETLDKMTHLYTEASCELESSKKDFESRIADLEEYLERTQKQYESIASKNAIDHSLKVEVEWMPNMMSTAADEMSLTTRQSHGRNNPCKSKRHANGMCRNASKNRLRVQRLRRCNSFDNSSKRPCNENKCDLNKPRRRSATLQCRDRIVTGRDHVIPEVHHSCCEKLLAAKAALDKKTKEFEAEKKLLTTCKSELESTLSKIKADNYVLQQSSVQLEEELAAREVACDAIQQALNFEKQGRIQDSIHISTLEEQAGRLAEENEKVSAELRSQLTRLKKENEMVKELLGMGEQISSDMKENITRSSSLIDEDDEIISNKEHELRLAKVQAHVESLQSSHKSVVEEWQSKFQNMQNENKVLQEKAQTQGESIAELEKRCATLNRLAESRSMLLKTYEEEVAATKAAKMETEKDLYRIRKDLDDLSLLLHRREPKEN